jgi:hypothetical protein
MVHTTHTKIFISGNADIYMYMYCTYIPVCIRTCTHMCVYKLCVGCTVTHRALLKFDGDFLGT